MRKIKNARLVITDSFHCLVMCLKLHIPFFVITEQEGNVAMNDRLYTLLAPLKMEERIIYKLNASQIREKMNLCISWGRS
jgi:exopolysaccharide biosynthesis predicted pyruvyltransferase EpsI